MKKCGEADILEPLRKEIFKTMDEKGWSQILLADFCQVDRNVVGGIIRRERQSISLRTLEKFAIGLGKKMSELVE